MVRLVTSTKRVRERGTFPAVGIGYRIYKTLGLTLVVWDGEVSGDEAEDQVRKLKLDPDWPPGPLHLLDTTTVTSAPLVANTKLVEMLNEIAESRLIRFAVIASGDSANEAVKFQAEVTVLGVSQVIVFNDVSAACSWLGIDLPATRATLADLRRELRRGRRVSPYTGYTGALDAPPRTRSTISFVTWSFTGSPVTSTRW